MLVHRGTEKQNIVLDSTTNRSCRGGKDQGGSALSVRLDADEEEKNVEGGVEMMVSSGLRTRECGYEND